MNLLLLAGWAVIPPALILAFHASFFVSILLYLALPSAYFSYKNPQIILRAVAVALAAMIVGSMLDYLAFLNGAWTVSTIFGVRVMQFVPIEDFLFVFFAAYVIVSGFDYFFPEFGLSRIKKARLATLFIATMVAFAAFLAFICAYPSSLHIPYYDAWLLGIGFGLPSAMLLMRYPAYVKPVAAVVAFQLIAMLPYELIADALGFWTFPGSEYIGIIHLLGQRFPIEEFLEWMVLMAPAVLGFNILMAGQPQVPVRRPG